MYYNFHLLLSENENVLLVKKVFNIKQLCPKLNREILNFFIYSFNKRSFHKSKLVYNESNPLTRFHFTSLQLENFTIQYRLF